MTMPWTAPTITPLTTAQDAQGGGLYTGHVEQFGSNPSGQPA